MLLLTVFVEMRRNVQGQIDRGGSRQHMVGQLVGRKFIARLQVNAARGAAPRRVRVVRMGDVG